MGIVHYVKVIVTWPQGVGCGEKPWWLEYFRAFLQITVVRPSSNFLLSWMSAQISNSCRAEADWLSLGQVAIPWANPCGQGFGVYDKPGLSPLTFLCLGAGCWGWQPQENPMDGEETDFLRKGRCCYQKKVGSMLGRWKQQMAIRAGKLGFQD